MAQHEVETQWMGKMQFNALVNGHTIIMDAPERVGGEDNGPIPKPFILTALSGCTGMDIAAILRKDAIDIQDMNIKVTGQLSKQAPIQYTSIHLVYEFRAAISSKDAVVNAVTLSQEKYCGVSAMLKKALPVTWEIQLNGQQVFCNKVEEAVLTTA